MLRRLPRRLVLALGRGFGRAWGVLDRRHGAIAADNLRRSFPEWDEARVWRTVAGVYAHFGQALFELLWLQGRSPEDLLALADFEGVEHVEAAMARGRGVLLVTAHIGNWEVHGVAHGARFGPIVVVARPLDNPDLDARLCAIRSMGGNGVVYKKKALARVIAAVRAGRSIALLIDQNVGEQDGIFVDFFGRPAATTTVAAALAIKTGCALVPCRTQLRPDGRYRVVYEPALRLHAEGERREEVARLTQELTRIVEGWVRETPEQWLWLHRRWKTQPRGIIPP